MTANRRLRSPNDWVEVKVALLRTVSRPLILSATPHQGLKNRFLLSVLSIWVALSHERTVLSFIAVIVSSTRLYSHAVLPSTVQLVYYLPLYLQFYLSAFCILHSAFCPVPCGYVLFTVLRSVCNSIFEYSIYEASVSLGLAQQIVSPLM
jgi:hypothetical protein